MRLLVVSFTLAALAIGLHSAKSANIANRIVKFDPNKQAPAGEGLVDQRQISLHLDCWLNIHQRIMNLMVSDQLTVKQLKDKVIARLSSAVKGVDLFFKNDKMDDSKRLDEYGVESGDTILIYQNFE